MPHAEHQGSPRQPGLAQYWRVEVNSSVISLPSLSKNLNIAGVAVARQYS